jgi:hypothetical protein
VQQQTSVVPTGFTYAAKITSLSAYTVLSSDYYTFQQKFEGYNIADLGWGTANAKTVTLSFWVYSSLTGTFGGSFFNASGARSYPFTYTISSANTWEQKSVTIAGDTSGTWPTDNSASIILAFTLGVGSSNAGPAGAWASAFYLGPTGATSVVGTNGATWYVTGVQLEAGTTASPFEYRQYGTELALCQRYFQKCDSYSGAANTTTNYIGLFTLQQTMRTTPSIGQTGVVYISDYVANDIVQSSASASVVNTGGGGTAMCCFLFNYSGMTAFKIYFSRMLNSNYVTFSAEL